MSPQRSLWKMLLISFFAFLVVACKPIASFSVSPDPVKAGVEATFDASATVIHNKPKNNTAKSYTWDFGDGTTATGKTATHTFAAAGTFKVKLTVIDTAGRVGVATENVVVTPGDAVVQTTTLKVITQIAGGVSLNGAEVTVGTATATSDALGLATLDTAPVGENQVVTVKKAGYVSQSVRATLTAGAEPQQLLVMLLPEKDTLSIANIEAAQTIRSNYLGASVTLPAGALVNASSGAPATGAATLKFTPWDISGIDLQAMPGNGLALDSTNQLVDLISAGMMSVDFFDAAGNKLQVAPGKSANIQMDLPAGTTNIGGNPIAAGTSIPLWHFDEARGLWIGEGTGTVVATSTGLAVTGTVSHFSIWNWDYVTATPSVGGSSSGGTVPPDASTLTLSCLNPEGALTACSVLGDITYPQGGGVRSWGVNIPASVTTIRNIPGNPTIVWNATTVDGLRGTATSGTTGNVVIQLNVPNVSNFVRCVAPANVATPCTVTRSAPLADGSVNTVTSYIPAEGATIRAQLDTAGPLTWAASTGFTSSANGTWTKYNGTTSSGLSGDVTINLVAEVISSGKTIRVSCLPNTLGEFFPPMALSSCSIQIFVYDADGAYVDTIDVASGLNGPVAVTLPALADGAQITMNATGTSDQPILGTISGYFEGTLGSLQENQLIELQLYDMPIEVNPH